LTTPKSGFKTHEHTSDQKQNMISGQKLDSKKLYMEVVKQLSKDSYGAGHVPISSEVLELLSA